MRSPTAVSFKRTLFLLLTGCTILAAAHPNTSFAQLNIYALPVETDLQRELVPKNAGVFVLIDAASFTTLDLSRLKRALAPYQNTDKHIHVSIFEADRNQEAHSLFRYAMLGFLYDSGFRSFSAYGHWSNVGTTWDALTENLRSKDDAPTEPEPAIVKDGVKAHVVLNSLSRFLASDADCVLILPAVHLEGGVLPAKIIDASMDAVASLELNKKDSVSFVLPHNVDGQRDLVIDRLFELGKLLQFDSASVSYR